LRFGESGIPKKGAAFVLVAPEALRRSDQWLERKLGLALLEHSAKMTTLLTIGPRRMG